MRRGALTRKAAPPVGTPAYTNENAGGITSGQGDTNYGNQFTTPSGSSLVLTGFRLRLGTSWSGTGQFQLWDPNTQTLLTSLNAASPQAGMSDHLLPTPYSLLPSTTYLVSTYTPAGSVSSYLNGVRPASSRVTVLPGYNYNPTYGSSYPSTYTAGSDYFMAITNPLLAGSPA